MLKERTKIRKTLNYLIRAAIILVTYGFIYRQVLHQKKPQEILHAIDNILVQRETWLMLGLLVLLMFVNWGLESYKWQLLIGKIEKVSFFKAYKAVLTGVSISLFTPNRTGDYLGRVFILDKGSHVDGILVTIVGSIAQFMVTLCIGLFCLLSFFDQYLAVSFRLHHYLLAGLILLVPVIVFFLLLFYFKIGLLADIIGRYFPGKWEKIARHIGVFGRFSSMELLWVLLISLARYVIFSSQFLILLRISGAAVPPAQGFILIPVIFLVMAIVPSIALADLGIRGSVSLYILGLYFTTFASGVPVPEIAILAASTALWLINLILPAILGTLFVFNLKFFRNNKLL